MADKGYKGFWNAFDKPVVNIAGESISNFLKGVGKIPSNVDAFMRAGVHGTSFKDAKSSTPRSFGIKPPREIIGQTMMDDGVSQSLASPEEIAGQSLVRRKPDDYIGQTMASELDLQGPKYNPEINPTKINPTLRNRVDQFMSGLDTERPASKDQSYSTAFEPEERIKIKASGSSVNVANKKQMIGEALAVAGAMMGGMSGNETVARGSSIALNFVSHKIGEAKQANLAKASTQTFANIFNAGPGQEVEVPEDMPIEVIQNAVFARDRAIAYGLDSAKTKLSAESTRQMINLRNENRYDQMEGIVLNHLLSIDRMAVSRSMEKNNFSTSAMRGWLNSGTNQLKLSAEFEENAILLKGKSKEDALAKAAMFRSNGMTILEILSEKFPQAVEMDLQKLGLGMSEEERKIRSKFFGD